MLGRRSISQCAVRASFVVVNAPGRNDGPSLRQRSEPVLVQALVAELAVEALHVRVLRRLAGLDEAQLDATLRRGAIAASLFPLAVSPTARTGAK